MAIAPAPRRALALIVLSSVSAAGLLAQTRVKPPKNKYTPEAGRAARPQGRGRSARAVSDHRAIERIARYLDRLGDRLVAAAPAELNNRSSSTRSRRST